MISLGMKAQGSQAHFIFYLEGTDYTNSANWVLDYTADFTASVPSQSVFGADGNKYLRTYSKDLINGYLYYYSVRIARKTNGNINFNFYEDGNSVGSCSKTATLWESDDKELKYSYPFHLYEKYNNVYYRAIKSSSNASDVTSFIRSSDFTEDEDVDLVLYYGNPNPSIVFFGEGEGDNFGNDGSRSFGNVANVADGDSYSLGTYPVGAYTMTIDVTDGNTVALYVGESMVKTYNTGVQTYSFDLAASSEISLRGFNEASGNFDYVVLQKTKEQVSVGDCGFATYCSNIPLDFSGVSGITAYIANKVDNLNAGFTKITKVPANTGILLKNSSVTSDMREGISGASASAIVPICTATTDNVDSNILVGSTEYTHINRYAGLADASTNFVLNKQTLANGRDETNFFRVPMDGINIRANSAYLQFPTREIDLPTADTKVCLTMTFDDEEVTGIENVTTSTITDNTAIYNLAGQKVDDSYKGIVIKNGKKYLAK